MNEWPGHFQRGDFKLSRFQRHEVWDRHRIAGLLETVIQDLPLNVSCVFKVDRSAGDRK